MDIKFAEVTVIKSVFINPCADLAVIVVVPVETAVTIPLELTVATAVLDDDQVTEFVITDVVPSVKLLLAANCVESPCGTEVKVELTDIALILTGLPGFTTPIEVLIPFCLISVFIAVLATVESIKVLVGAPITTRLLKAD
jgi:hypothetical protein